MFIKLTKVDEQFVFIRIEEIVAIDEKNGKSTIILKNELPIDCEESIETIERYLREYGFIMN